MDPEVVKVLVARVTATAIFSSVFVYFAVKLWIKTWLEIRYPDKWWLKLSVNGATGLISIIVSVLVYIVAIQLLPANTVIWAELILITILTTAAATYGNEVVDNYGRRALPQEVIDIQTYDIGNIIESNAIAIGKETKAGQ